MGVNLSQISQKYGQESKNGFPNPVKAHCFKCQKQFWIKFVVPQQNYSLKNSWDYWTNQKEDKDKKICNSCLRKFYLEEKKSYLETIKDLKKRKILGSYVSSNSV